MKLPELLNELTFGHCFNQPMDKAKIRELYESQKLGAKFRWLSQWNIVEPFGRFGNPKVTF